MHARTHIYLNGAEYDITHNFLQNIKIELLSPRYSLPFMKCMQGIVQGYKAVSLSSQTFPPSLYLHPHRGGRKKEELEEKLGSGVNRQELSIYTRPASFFLPSPACVCVSKCAVHVCAQYSEEGLERLQSTRYSNYNVLMCEIPLILGGLH